MTRGLPVGFTSELLVRNKFGIIVSEFGNLETVPRFATVQDAVDVLIGYMMRVAEEYSYFASALEFVAERDSIPTGAWYDRVSC